MTGTATSMDIPQSSSVVEAVADTANEAPQRAERFIEGHQRFIRDFTRVGWLAKGVVYLLFGVTAIAIAQQSSAPDEASPQGALGQVMEAPAGRGLMAVMAVGLLLYALWRTASAILIDGSGLQEWGDRIGYSFSAIFYALLAITAGRSAWSGVEPGESNTIEKVSRSLLENGLGRIALGLGGLITMAIGAYFAIHKGAQRSFVDDVAGISKSGPGSGALDRAIYMGGIVGWVGRGVVTALVGFFVVRAAVSFDSDEARGFDQALREATTTTAGSLLVWVSAIGLVAYGAFCILSHRRRTLGQSA